MAMTPRGMPTPSPIFVAIEVDEEEEEEDDDDDDVAAGDEDSVEEVEEVSVGMEVAEVVLLDEVLVAEAGSFSEPGEQEYSPPVPKVLWMAFKPSQSMSYLLVALMAPPTSRRAGKDRLVRD